MPNKRISPQWPLNSECVGRPIMNEKMPNKYNVPATRSYTFDSEKNEWLEYSDNFYFFDGEDAKVFYHYYDKNKDSDS
jgi:hypothetical protein